MNNKVEKSLKQKTGIKVISGLNNFNQSNVLKIAKAAKRANCTFIDIAAAPKLVENVKKEISDLPICVSAIKPELFVDCVKVGADLIEIGNFDSLYNQGYKISFKDILYLVKKTRSLLPNTLLSVTIPYLLPLNMQLELAFRLETLKVDIIQTEGKLISSKYIDSNSKIENILPTLASTYLLANNVSLPIICASGLSLNTASIPFQLNASGIGIGTAISKLKSEEEMYEILNKIYLKVNNQILVKF
uniref:Uncharacterized protein ycf23 n=1 Tax=Cyanophora sudae TaxID=1522369 RepID=A0A2Z4HFU8_9EUKA|nr:hypothetical protein [Cyanophora sudae]AWW13638.1 hypothetical protein [Cyanophora sudae]